MKLTGRRSWGDWFLVLTAIVSLVAVVRSGYSGHFEIFANSARLLWRGGNPYGISYPSGYWFYSPACGLFFYGMFAWFPYALGVGLYLLASLAALAFGLRALRRAMPLSPGAEQVFAWLLASEVIGCVLNARLELFMTGALLGATAALVRARGLKRAGLAMGFVCGWKLTLLPVVGLWWVASLRDRTRRTFAVSFALGLLASLLLPMLVRSPLELFAMHRDWSTSLRAYMLGGENWLGFQQLFAFAHRSLGFTVPFEGAQAIGLGVAALLALVAWRSAEPARKASADSLYLFLSAIGVAYSLAFSPLSQSAGYLLYAPLLFAAFRARADSEGIGERRAWSVLIAFAWFLVSAAYSDLVPHAWRAFFFDHSAKAVGVCLLAGGLIGARVRPLRRWGVESVAWGCLGLAFSVAALAKTLAQPLGQDFPAYFQAGERFWRGENPYVAGDAKAYKYAPTWLLAFALLPLVPYALSRWLFSGVILGALILIPWLVRRICLRQPDLATSASERACAFGLALVGALRFADGELYNVQVNAIGVALILAAVDFFTRPPAASRVMERAREIAGGFLFVGGALLKFHPLMGLGVFLRASAYRTWGLLVAVIATLAFVPKLAWWPELARQLRETTPLLEANGPTYIYQGFYGAFGNFFGTRLTSSVPFLVFAVVAAGWVRLVPKFDFSVPQFHPSRRPLAFLLGVLSLLLLALTSSPLAWQHTYVVTLGAIPAAFLAGRGPERALVTGLALFLGLSARGVVGLGLSNWLEVHQSIFLGTLALSALLLRQSRRWSR